MEETVTNIFLASIRHRFKSIKSLDDKTIEQLSDADTKWHANDDSNSIAIIIQHIHGSMISRWTDFLTTDGEKNSRYRDGEFSQPDSPKRDDLIALWDKGWKCLFKTLDSLNEDDLVKEIKIRGQELTVIDAINRQLSHNAYHIGQIVQIAKERLGADWKTLSIARSESSSYTPVKRD